MNEGRPGLMALLFILGGCTAANPDYMAQPCSTLGDRQCIVSLNQVSFPAVCGKDAMGKLALLQEVCPQGALCSNGQCVPPDGASRCARRRDCASGEVCVPLVADSGQAAALDTFCVQAPVGLLADRGACKRDEQCESALCLQHSGEQKYCLRVCKTELDCAVGDVCRSFHVTVTGVPGTILSCSPSRP